MKKYILLLVAACCAPDAPFSHAQDDLSWASREETGFTPKVHHPNIKDVTLFAQNPEIVTPIGIAVAPDGRVFVQENHTHKRNSDYEGPETDRILVFEDKDKDGFADDRSVFYEGHTFSTDLLFGPDGHLYVSTRWFIGRFPNASNKAKADGEPEKLIVCQTDGNYPHNGVGGLAIDPASPEWLAFGFGENLGADYTFVGSDGVKLSGGAEGGSTYRCRMDGSKLTRQSTGHWNAFGMAYDLDGNLFSTDNDPNATPPNRLLHIVPGGNFGYEYRYGRSGRHPLICWNGENPGTLGMIGALGEAACGLVPHGPGKLLSASWTDNRVDLHSLTAKGDSFTATREPFLSGPDDFRPVHFSYSVDGRYLYFTDWVKLSYPVHGHGRIWRIEFKQPISLKPSANRPATNEFSIREALAKLGSGDPYARTAAVQRLATEHAVLKNYKWQLAGGVARAHYAVALKRSDADGRTDVIPALLDDEDSDVRYVGIKWIADEKLSGYAHNLKAVLDRSALSRRDLLAVVSALEVVGKAAELSGKATANSPKMGKLRNKEFSPSNTLLELALDTNKSSELRAIALANVEIDHPKLTVATLQELAESKHEGIQREAVHSLVIHEDTNRSGVLAKIAADKSLGANLRADAIAGLASAGRDHQELLNALSSERNRVISQEANRTRVAAGLANRHVETKPKPDQIDEWIELLNREATQKPDPAVGRRLFFHSNFAGCYKCHAIHGRGNSVGPDLTGIHKQADVNQDWLLKHIVNPNAEMAPYYRPQQLVTVDGKVLVGLIVGKEGQKQGYVATDGTVFYIDKEDVEERREMTTSIMPSGLMDTLSANEIRHLLAFLLSPTKEHPINAGSNSRTPPVGAQKKERVRLIAGFEDQAQIAKTETTHKASVNLVADPSPGGGKRAAKTMIDDQAGTEKFFGTGFRFPAIDLSGARDVRFWIKTDIESNFNFQIHDGSRASAFGFSIDRARLGKWTEIIARLADFKQPPWSKDGKADPTKVAKIQITAFGSGPYDGNYILLDHVRSVGTPTGGKMPQAAPNSNRNKTEHPAVVQRGGPVHVEGAEDASSSKSPPEGFRSLFDGNTLKGWTPKARLPVPTYPGAPFKWRLQGEALEKAKKNTGRWTVENGAIVGGQDPPGSGKGAYLVSEETFGDFELMMDMKSDWKTDSGFLVRTVPDGSPGMQILVDHRPQGGIGGFYGNGIAGIHGMAFAIDAKYDKQGNPIGIIAADPKDSRVELSKKTADILSYAADVEALLQVWKWGGWNTIKVRCEGRIPKLTTWVNGVKIAVLDMNEIEWKNYDKEACAKMLGNKGHISLEVHNNNFNHWLGKDRWWPGAVVRWKNIFIRELE